MASAPAVKMQEISMIKSQSMTLTIAIAQSETPAPMIPTAITRPTALKAILPFQESVTKG